VVPALVYPAYGHLNYASELVLVRDCMGDGACICANLGMDGIFYLGLSAFVFAIYSRGRECFVSSKFLTLSKFN
jgi:hypothetical protein